MPSALGVNFDRGIPTPVPPRVRRPYRAGTPDRCPGESRKSWIESGLGVPGARLAPLADPWPLVCLGAPARWTLASCHAGRSATVPHKRPGLRPGTPANGPHARHDSFRVLSAGATAVRPRLRRAKPDQTIVPFTSANSSPAHHSGPCARRGVIGVPHPRCVYLRFPVRYAHSTTEGETVIGAGLRAAAEIRSAPQTVRSARTVVRRDARRVGRGLRNRAADLSCEGSRPEGSPSTPLSSRGSAVFAATSRNLLFNRVYGHMPCHADLPGPHHIRLPLRVEQVTVSGVSCFRSPICMLRWFEKIIGKKERLPCVHEEQKGEVAVRVIEYEKKCGHPGYLIELFVRPEGASELPVACLGWEDLAVAIELMQAASEVVSARIGLGVLPTVRMRNKSFFVDERLSELRNVDDPQDRIAILV